MFCLFNLILVLYSIPILQELILHLSYLDYIFSTYTRSIYSNILHIYMEYILQDSIYLYTLHGVSTPTFSIYTWSIYFNILHIYMEYLLQHSPYIHGVYTPTPYIHGVYTPTFSIYTWSTYSNILHIYM